MDRARRLASLLFAAAGLGMVWSGYGLGLGGEFGPGPGFFAFCVGLLLTLSAALWFVRIVRGSSEREAPFVSDTGGAWRVAVVSIAIIAFAILVEPLGYRITMLALLVVLLTAFGREYRVWKIAIAIAASVGTHYALTHLLRVSLPASSIGVLRALGL